MTAETDAENTRRVRPWIAALLTFLGWGLGFYYARQTRAAILWAVGGIIFGLALGGAAIGYMLYATTVPAVLSTPFAPFALIGLNIVLTAVVAVFAWRAAARRQRVQGSSPLRLLGYVLILVVPMLASEAAAVGVRSFWLQPFRMPSGSMQPTLHVGDYFLVSKQSYGYGPYSTAPYVGLIEHRTGALTPQRGDVVVFRPLHEPNRDFVKRIVGLPGERIQMIDGVLRINGAAVQMESLGEVDFLNGDGYRERIPAYRETLPGGVTHTIFDRNPSGELDNTRVFVVPEGHYFMMGDDRDFSDDSRRSVGYVPLDNLVGRVDRIMRAPRD